MCCDLWEKSAAWILLVQIMNVFDVVPQCRRTKLSIVKTYDVSTRMGMRYLNVEDLGNADGSCLTLGGAECVQVC